MDALITREGKLVDEYEATWVGFRSINFQHPFADLRLVPGFCTRATASRRSTMSVQRTVTSVDPGSTAPFLTTSQ